MEFMQPEEGSLLHPLGGLQLVTCKILCVLMASSNQLEKFLGSWRSAKRDTVAHSVILQENARNRVYSGTSD